MESREAVDININRYLLGLKRRWIPAVTAFAATVGLSLFATTLLKPSYEGEGKLLFKTPSFKLVGSGVLPNNNEGEEVGDLRSLVATQNPISSQIEVISSPQILQKVIDELQLKNKDGEPLTPEDLRTALTIKIVGGTDVLRLVYQSKNPEEAAAVINKLMTIYIENDISTTQAEAEQTRQVLAQQLPRSEQAVKAAETRLRNFREQNRSVNLDEEARSAIATIANIDNQITNVQAELNQISAQIEAVRNNVDLNSQQALNATAVSQSQAVQDILKQLQDVDRQLAVERSRFSEQNPVIINLVAKQANLQSLLQREIQATVGQTQVPQGQLQVGELRQSLIKEFLQLEAQRRGLSQRLNSLSNSRAAYVQRVNSIPKLQQNQNELQQRLEVARSSYQLLLRKAQELQVAASRNISNARIIVKAVVPEKPIGGKKPIILALGVLLGTCAATSTIFFLETTDRSLKTLDEVKEAFKYTLLGVVPFFGKKVRSRNGNAEATTPEVPVRDLPDSLTSEMFRMIQANLKFLSSDKVLKTITITSAVAKEGKSTVAANLAAAIAQLGRKVLLIDADMRLPTQHHIWDLTNAQGLSEVLVGQADVNTAVSKVMDNLHVLTAGVRPPNPLALVDSKRMSLLVQDFSLKYDFVIIDAPPLLVAADALTVSQMTDGIMLVTRPGVIDLKNVNAAKETLERSGQVVLGIVVNALSEKNQSSNYFAPTKTYFAEEANKRGLAQKRS